MSERPIRSREKARWLGINCPDLRCGLCGDYGAEWITIHERALARCLCPTHRSELAGLLVRHRDELTRFVKVHFKQDGEAPQPEGATP